MTDSQQPGDLLAKLQHWAAEIDTRGIVASEVGTSVQKLLVHSQGERLDVPDDPIFVIMLCGPAAVGKSSLVNALAGSEISRTGIGATTSAAVVYIHERNDPNRLFEYNETLGQLGREPMSLVRHSRDELLHRVLVDTPDIDSVRRDHHEVTEALVRCADLVLFVTSPEKYKATNSSDWIAELRGQRALAFIMNKWDRSSLGLQYDQRSIVDTDFRKVITSEGFANPVIFKLSAEFTGEENENQLEDLKNFVERDLNRSTAITIQDRRRRAAWGRIGSVVAEILPQGFSRHPFIKECFECLKMAQMKARQAVGAQALTMEFDDVEISIRPNPPGLLGGWLSFVSRMWAFVISACHTVSGWAALKWTATTRFDLRALMDRKPFGASATAVLATAISQLKSTNNGAARLPLGPVHDDWSLTVDELGARLARIPSAVQVDLILESSKPSFRRTSGWLTLITLEILIIAILVATIGKVGLAFFYGTFMPDGTIENSSVIIALLIVIGQVSMRVFFPTSKERFRRSTVERAYVLIDGSFDRARESLSAQVAAVDRLGEEGRDLLRRLGEMVRSLSEKENAGADDVSRFFGSLHSDVTTSYHEDKSDEENGTLPERKPPVFD